MHAPFDFELGMHIGGLRQFRALYVELSLSHACGIESSGSKIAGEVSWPSPVIVGIGIVL